MSGTSIDGLDLVYAKFVFEESRKFKIISTKTYEYDNEWQVILKSIVKNNINRTNVICNYIVGKHLCYIGKPSKIN